MSAPVVPSVPSAEILSIGNEILLGEIVDTNSAFLAAELARLGLALRGSQQLPDDRARIAAAFAEALERSDLVVATGGLGPTHDDLTREGLAEALGEPLAPDPALEARLRARMGGTMPSVNLKQALLIASARPLENPIGSAPGWWAERDGHVAVLMPGVPAEMRRMWAEQAVPRLSAAFALRRLHARTVKTFGIGESALAERLGSLLETVDPDAGVYARDDGVHIRFSTRSDPSLLEPLVARACELLDDAVYGVDDETLPRRALAVLGSAGVRTLATVEFGTAGALLAILASEDAAPGRAAFVGGGLEAPPAVEADAVLRLRLLPEDGHGRSEVEVSVEAAGAAAIPTRRFRVHGSGPQRLRRAAFGALDIVRRELG